MTSRLAKALLALVLITSPSLFAIPVLQLDILGGVYDNSTQTTVATTSSFTLRALFKGPLVPDSYYISAAISPGLPETSPVPNFGSVNVDGNTYLPSAFNYGTPPVDVIDTDPDGIDLQPHGIFPTYYLEFGFAFDPSHTVSAYNVQSDDAAPGILYYHDFTIDVSGLAGAYVLHFDLYSEGMKHGDYGVDCFAPFSKDAESGHTNLVPDRGSALVLFTMGLALLGVWRRKSN